MPHIDPNIPPPVALPPIFAPPAPTFPGRGPAPGPLGRPVVRRAPTPGSEADLIAISVERFLCGLGDENACAALRARGISVEAPTRATAQVGSRVPVPGATPPFVPAPAPVLPPLERQPGVVETVVLGAARAVSGVFQRGPLSRPISRTEGAGVGTRPRTFPRAAVGGYAAAAALARG